MLRLMILPMGNLFYVYVDNVSVGVWTHLNGAIEGARAQLALRLPRVAVPR